MQKFEAILLVDDDAVSNLICENLLKRTGICKQSKSFTKAEEALRYLESIKKTAQLPDVIFLDLNMPLIDGWEFIRRYEVLRKDITKNIKIYILTSSIAKEDKKEAQKYTLITGFIVKPFTEEKLLKIFEENA